MTTSVGELIRRRVHPRTHRSGVGHVPPSTGWSAPHGSVVQAGGLAVRTLGDRGAPVLLLHGLGGSERSWGSTYDDTLATDRRLIVPDLLGFGQSPHPPTGYSPDDHANAVVGCLDALGITEPVAIGAHSLGSLVALRIAAAHPGRVRAIVAFGPPLYPDRVTARRHIAGTSLMGRLVVLPGPVGHMVCAWMCRHRRLAAKLAVWGAPDTPAAIARASVDHTWASYSQTIQQVILDAQAGTWLKTLTIPVRFIAGDKDPRVDLDYLHKLVATHPNVTLDVWAGGHDLPLVQADRCAAAIADAI